MENGECLGSTPFSIYFFPIIIHNFYFNNLLKRPAPVSYLPSTSAMVKYAR
jgi:hypothetical protein